MCSIACGAVFRRIKEVIEDTRDTSICDGLDPGDMPGIPVHGPARPHRKRRQEDNALTNLQKFRRIQLVDDTNTDFPQANDFGFDALFGDIMDTIGVE